MSDNWLFFNACGHPFGLHVATPTVQTERQAWNAFYWTEKERRAAEDRGVTCRRVDHDTYREQWAQLMRDGCDCEPVPDPVPAGRGVCAVCDREMRVLKDGTIGPHTTGRPDPRGSRFSPRCPGWGRKPKEN
jgi:hypothetical protein